MLIHPLLRLAIKEPHLLAGHLKAYVGLAGEEASTAASSVALKVGLYAGAGVMSFIGLLLVGVELLLMAATQSVDRTSWAMFLVPVVPFLTAATMIFIARSKPLETAFDTLNQQLYADMAMLREISL